MSREIEKMILEELKTLSKTITIIFGDRIEKELSKIATTNERKIIWVLIDGRRMSKEIAKMLGITEQAVNTFLRSLAQSGFAENPRGKPPKRIINYVPPSWLELFEKFEENMKNEK